MSSEMIDQNPEIPLFGMNGENRLKVKTYAIMRNDNEEVVDGMPVDTRTTAFSTNHRKSDLPDICM